METKIETLTKRIDTLEKQIDVLIRLFAKNSSSLSQTQEHDLVYEDGGLDNLLLSLTPKQTATLQMLNEAFETKQMVEALAMTESTIKTHISLLFKKFSVKNRSSLILRTQGRWDEVDDDIYLRHTGIPKDWVKTLDLKNPCKYTLMLREKRRK